MRHLEAIAGTCEETPEDFDYFPKLNLRLAQLALAKKRENKQFAGRTIVTDTVTHYYTTTPVMSGRYVTDIKPDPELL